MRNILTKLSRAVQLAEDVPLEANRDHLGPHIPFRSGDTSLMSAANERTFHAWLRLSMGISAMGVVIAQMSQIQHVIHPDPRLHPLKNYVLGVPQAAICHLLAIFVIVVAALRFFKHERAIKQGRAHVGGWELMVTAGLILLVRRAFLELCPRLRWTAPTRVLPHHLLRQSCRSVLVMGRWSIAMEETTSNMSMDW